LATRLEDFLHRPRLAVTSAYVVALWCLPLLAIGVFKPASAHHYGLLAQAFLQGHLDLPARTYDDTFWHGHVYLPWGPFPSVLLMPLVATWGSSIPMVVLTVPATVLSAVGLMRLWRALGVDELGPRAWLTVLTLGGTSFLASAVLNSTYFTEHAVSFTLVTWALVLAFEKRLPLVAGVLIGLAALTRAPNALIVIPVAFVYIRGMPLSEAARRWAWLALGALPGIALVFLYNAVRFGSPLDSGYGPQILVDPTLIAARNVGLFSLAHLPKNLYYFLVAGPLPLGGERAAVLKPPFITFSQWGTGLVWVSPWLFLGLWARGKVAVWLWTGVATLLALPLLYYGIGWIQFGFRYATDATPLIAALAVLGSWTRGWRRWIVPVTIYCLVVNLVGTYWLVFQFAGA
jgi:hypothetical protein